MINDGNWRPLATEKLCRDQSFHFEVKINKQQTDLELLTRKWDQNFKVDTEKETSANTNDCNLKSVTKSHTC